MKMLEMVKDDHGQIMEITVRNPKKEPIDISNYTVQKQVIFGKPDGEEISKSSTFKNNGEDGILVHTKEDIFDMTGQWWIRTHLTSTSGVLTSDKTYFMVIS